MGKLVMLTPFGSRAMIVGAYSNKVLFDETLNFLKNNCHGAWTIEHIPDENDKVPYFFAGSVEPEEMAELKDKAEIIMAKAYPRRYRSSQQAFYNLGVEDNRVVYHPG